MWILCNWTHNLVKFTKCLVRRSERMGPSKALQLEFYGLYDFLMLRCCLVIVADWTLNVISYSTCLKTVGRKCCTVRRKPAIANNCRTVLQVTVLLNSYWSSLLWKRQKPYIFNPSFLNNCFNTATVALKQGFNLVNYKTETGCALLLDTADIKDLSLSLVYNTMGPIREQFIPQLD